MRERRRMVPGCEGHGDVYCSDCGATLGRAEAECERLREQVRVLEEFARYAMDIVADYEQRAHAALAKGGE